MADHDTNDASTPEARRNLELVREYVGIAYDPKRASAKAVAHLCAPGNVFTAPTTFPGVRTPGKYAEEHGKVMKQIADLHLVSLDVFYAHGDKVCLRYTAEGTTAASRTARSRRLGGRRAGRPPRCSGWRAGNWQSSSRTGTNWPCGSSSAGRPKSA